MTLSAHRAGALARFAAIIAASLPPLDAQADPVPNFANTLRSLARSSSPAVRGEAALTLGMLGDTSDRALIETIALERPAESSVPATIALGYLGIHGVEYTLGTLFQRKQRSSQPRRLAAAFAFGLLDEHHATPLFDDFLAKVPGGSYSKNSAALSAWLAGQLCSARPGRRSLPEFLLEDVANRDVNLRLLAASALTRRGDRLTPNQTSSLLEANDARLRRLGLELTPADRLLERSKRRAITKLTRRARNPAVRAASLRLLIRARVFAALDCAPAALESDHPDELSAGVAAVLAFGGHRLRGTLESQILNETSTARRVAMLKSWTGRPSPRFTNALIGIIEDHETPIPVVCAAARIAASSENPNAANAIRGALGRTTEPAELSALLQTLGSDEHSADPVAPNPLSGLPTVTRVCSLFLAEARHGEREFCAAITTGGLSDKECVASLRAWRRSQLRPLHPDLLAAMPKELEAIFAPR